ncbi:MAG: hypothetical protein AAF614_38670 [Chloroflexota bacterium]
MSGKSYHPLGKQVFIILACLLLIGSIQAASAAPGDIERVSVDDNSNEANGSSHTPSLSSNGRFVAFMSSAANLVDNDGNGLQDIFVYDRQTDTVERVSVDSSGNEADGGSSIPAISGDGRFVAFVSDARNLVGGDSGFFNDIFLHDRQHNNTIRISEDSSGTVGNDDSGSARISGNGRFVAFASRANNLVADDNNNHRDIFVYDQEDDVMTRVSVASDGSEGNGSSRNPSISDDGRFISFLSWADNLVEGDTNGVADVFVHDQQTGETTRVSVSNSGGEAVLGSDDQAISGNGRFVAFESASENLVSDDTNGRPDIFVHDRQAGITARISKEIFATGSGGGGGGGGAGSNGVASNIDLSSDGQLITYAFFFSDLIDNDSNFTFDIFVYNQQSDVNSRISVDSNDNEANGQSGFPSISGNGRFVAFESRANNLVSNDSNGSTDIFVKEQATLLPPASCDLSSGFNVIHGTSRNDRLKGTPGNDIIIGYGGGDTIEGLGGNDCLIGGEGNDRLIGGEGNDIMWGGEVDNSTVYDRRDRDRLYGEAGNDELHGGGDHDHLEGDAGNDLLYGDDGNDGMHGDDGHDAMHGGSGKDRMEGRDGDDRMFGDAGDDTIIGRDGNDFLDGGADRDRLEGGEGDDWLRGGAGNDRMNGDDGNDIMYGDGGEDSMQGRDGEDEMYGGSGDDDMNGGRDNDMMYGNADNDRMDGDRGDDIMQGNSGNDIVDGRDGNDQLAGNDGDDELKGGKGDDLLDGGADTDHLDGHRGTDTCLNGESLKACEL